MTPSNYQLAIFDFLEKQSSNFIVQAVAGSGKTTTCKKGLSYVPRSAQIYIGAFNKDIAEVYANDAPPNVTSCTFNAFGWRVCKNMMPGIERKPNEYKTWNILRNFVDYDTESAIYNVFKGPVKRLVSLFKANCLFTRPTDDQISAMMAEFDIQIKFGGQQRFLDTVGNVYEACLRQQRVLDFDDQVFMPVYLNLPMPNFDLALIDECQDLNPIQIEMILRLAKRVGSVGDRYQAIYAFRGADTKAMETLISRTNATELPLSICYRCSKNVVRAAQKIVSHIEYWENAPEGIVDEVKKAEFRTMVQPGDFVLCRTNAPLVSECLRLIREKRKARVKGREVGDQLISTIDSINTANTDDLQVFYGLLVAHHQREMERLGRLEREDLILALNDTVETIKVLLEASDTLKQVRATIVELFTNTDFSNCVIFSSIHKSKGLETDRVFLLCPELLPHPAAKRPTALEQERNLEYVGLTRAKRDFYRVQSEAR